MRSRVSQPATVFQPFPNRSRLYPALGARPLTASAASAAAADRRCAVALGCTLAPAGAIPTAPAARTAGDAGSGADDSEAATSSAPSTAAPANPRKRRVRSGELIAPGHRTPDAGLSRGRPPPNRFDISRILEMLDRARAVAHLSRSLSRPGGTDAIELPHATDASVAPAAAGD